MLSLTKPDIKKQFKKIIATGIKPCPNKLTTPCEIIEIVLGVYTTNINNKVPTSSRFRFFPKQVSTQRALKFFFFCLQTEKRRFTWFIKCIIFPFSLSIIFTVPALFHIFSSCRPSSPPLPPPFKIIYTPV